jgi:hypothetical protein
MTTFSSGAGAINRIIELNCNEKLFADGNSSANALKSNFGMAGKMFVEWLSEGDHIEEARKMFNCYMRAFQDTDVTDKQIMAASLILTADELIEEWIFQDGVRLEPKDITPYLVSKETVNQNGRALQYLYDFVNMHQVKFSPDVQDYTGEIWGDMDSQYIYIIKSKFDQILSDEGYNSSAFIGWARNNGSIHVDPNGKTAKVKRIKGKPCRCIWLKNEQVCPEDDDCEVDELF